MTATGLYPTDPDWDDNARRSVAGLGDGLARTICIARVLVGNGRVVDLAGLDRGVGLFCAKVLDLPHAEGQSLVPQMQALLTEVDALTAALRQSAT